jgi:predicted ArsR family transcriptional regulator
MAASTTTTQEPAGRTVKSSERTLGILEHLAAARRPRSLGELSRELGIPKSSLHAILRTMEERGWVQTDASGLGFGHGGPARGGGAGGGPRAPGGGAPPAARAPRI